MIDDLAEYAEIVSACSLTLKMSKAVAGSSTRVGELGVPPCCDHKC